MNHPVVATEPILVAEVIARVYAQLSRSHRVIADFVLLRPLYAASLTIDKLAALTGVSDATANRFARKIGFEGYSEFRTALVQGSQELLVETQNVAKDSNNLSASKFQVSNMFSELIAGVYLLQEKTRILDCERAVEVISNAPGIYVFGEGCSAWLAGIAHKELSLLHSNVRLLNGIEGNSFVARCLAHAEMDEVVWIISSSMPSPDMAALLQIVRTKHCSVVALTNGYAHRDLLPADITVSCGHKQSSDYDIAALTMIKTICAAVGYAIKVSASY